MLVILCYFMLFCFEERSSVLHVPLDTGHATAEARGFHGKDLSLQAREI